MSVCLGVHFCVYLHMCLCVYVSLCLCLCICACVIASMSVNLWITLYTSPTDLWISEPLRVKRKEVINPIVLLHSFEYLTYSFQKKKKKNLWQHLWKWVLWYFEFTDCINKPPVSQRVANPPYNLKTHQETSQKQNSILISTTVVTVQ